MSSTGSERTVRLSVPEMDCPSCAGKVTASVERLDAVQSVDPQVATGTVAVTFDAGGTDREAVVERVEAAGYAVEGGETRTERLQVPEMDCPTCAGKVENALEALSGVVEFDAQPATGRVAVTTTAETDRSEVVAAVEGAGYEVADATTDDGPEMETPQSVWTSVRAVKTWVGGLFLLAAFAVEFLAGANPAVFAAVGRSFTAADVLFLLAAGTAGQEVVRNGYYSAKNRNLDIDLLMGVGIVSALAVDLYLEAATLAVLFSIAELLERFSMDRARNSLRELMELSPDTATVLRDGEEVSLPVEEVHVGDTAVVRPGEKIPADGEVTDGESAVNQAPITGESVPVDKTPGDEVFAGTINEGGYLELDVTAEAGDTTLASIVEQVSDAQQNRTDREQFIDRFASYYTPVVVVAALLTAVVPPVALGAPFEQWFVRGLTLLVVACPCAFVISTPVSVVSGVTSAARNGVLVKGGDHLEATGEAEAVALDKTGTLTKGELSVTDVVPLNGNDERDLLRCAASLERRSEHPIADAILARADRENVGERDVADFESLTGKGVRADLDGVTHYAGKPALFADLGFELDHVHLTTDGGVRVESAAAEVAAGGICERDDCVDLTEVVPRLQREGKTIVLVGTEDELEGVVAIADEVRPGAADAVARLQRAGLEVVMLTGDNEGTARAIAEQVGVDDYRAELLPEQKVAAVEDLAERHDGVAMVGDGINDAPAMAAATVGIAMGAAGTDTAIETADIALMGDDLRKLPYLYDLAHTANGVIRQNVWASLAVKAVLAVGAPLGFVTVVHAVVIGDMGMSLGVTGNAMRLARIRPDTE